MEPMLAVPTNLRRERMESFTGPDYWLQQKLDGQRILLTTNGAGKVTTFNRRGDVTFAPSAIEKALVATPFPLILDGELVDGRVVAFDCLAANTAVTPDMPLRDRLAALERLVPALGLPVTVARTARNPVEKEAMLAEVIAGNGEGWMAKRVLSTYTPGTRSRDWRKLKRVSDIDCVVEWVGEDKLNIGLSLYRGNTLVNVAECTRLAGSALEISPGDVVAVQTLYASEDDRLVQPTRPRIRRDKAREECTWDQLDEIRTNRFLVLA
jgi:ATP-dependent DNA ligase